MADTTDNNGFPEDDDLFGGDNRGNNREQKGESLEDVLREGSGGDREDRSIANIHTGSKVDHESVNMAAPPEGAPPPETPEVIPEEYTPGDPPPPIDPIDVEQQAAGNYVPEERPLDFELRQRERGDEAAAVEEVQEEDEVRRRIGDVDSEGQEELLARPTTATEPSLPPEVDDSPEAPVALNSVLDEDDLASGSDGTGARSVTQPLIIDFGDDGAGEVRLEVPQALRQMEVGPDNSVLNIEINEAGSQITAVDSEGSPVFTVTLNSGEGGYSYTFELQGSIDHGDLDQVDLPIGISVTDSDGDAAFGEFTVGIVDDEPVAQDDELQSLEEGGGTVGSENGADNLLDNDTLGADGALIFQFTYTDENGEQQTARAGETVDTENGTLTVEADGSWSFEADSSIDHTDGEAVFDGFTYSIVDADGDTSSATQEIKITDDGPTIDLGDGPNGGASATLFEKDISDNDASVSNSLNIDFGADGEGSVALTIPQELEDMGLTADGNTVTYALSDDGQSITASAGGETVFTMSITEGEDGEYGYTFDLQGNLDHPDAGSDILSNLPFEVEVTDGDGSTATAEININVVDDQPEAVGEVTLRLEEGGNTVGSDNGGANLLANDDVGADGGAITSFVYTDENGDQQTADAGSTVDTENGTLTVNADGSWSFESDPDADHSGGDTVVDKFTYTLTDGDGDTSSAVQRIEITDDGPTIPPKPPGGDGDGDNPDLGRADLVVDEDNMGAAVSQDIEVDFGADGFGSAALSVPSELEDMNLTSGGEAIMYSVSEDGQSITATADGETVFTVDLQADAETGELSYSVTLEGAVDHPESGASDDLLSNLPVTLTVTDGDGTEATSTLEIGIIDDTPTAENDGTVTLEEGGDTLSVSATDGLLSNDDVGADGGAITSFTYTDEAGNEQTADAGSTVDTENGTLTVNGDGSWSFESDPNADHSEGDTVADGFTYTITDGDGDTATATQNIELTDDGPKIPPKSPPPHEGDGDNPDLGRADLIVDEDNMGAAVSQDIEVDFGADGFGSAALSVPSELEDMNLTSGGEAITYSVSEDGQSITATADGETVFTVDLQADSETGELSYSVTLEGAVDHPESGASDDLLSNLPVTLTVTDGDGTEATSTLEIGIIDDTPTAENDGTVTLEEGGDTLSVSATDGLLSNDDVGADGGAITSFTYTDEAGNEQTADAGSTVDTENGTLTVNADGSWSFESDPNADHGGNETVADGFTYTITDGDGDTASATQNIELTDDGPKIPPKPPGGDGDGDNPDLGRADLVVDEDNMGAAVSQDIEVDFGADGFGSAALSVPSELEGMNLTSGGEAITYSVSEDGQSITATADGETVFTVDLQADAETGELSYSVTLEGAVDHPESGASDDLLSNLPVTLTVTDGDGTEATSTLEIGIIDDTPTAENDGTVTLEEGGDTLSVSATDGLLSNDDVGADGGAITSFTYTDEAGNEQTADAGSTVDTENGTLTVNGDGSWSFESDPNADHSEGDTVADGFTYTITDGDGDSATATQAIEITDDGPKIGPPPGNGGDGEPNVEGYSVTVDEDDLAGGAADAGQGLDIDFGADGEGSVALSVPQELQDMNITSDGEAVTFAVAEDGQSVVGTTPDGNPVLTISLEENDGSYSYGVELHENVDHGGDNDDVLSDLPVTLTVTDGDGDTASATLTVNVIDDAPVAVDDGEYNLSDGNETIGTDNGSDNLLANDDLGADGSTITSFTYTDENGDQQAADAGSTVDTEQGTLTVNGDGTWSFESDDLIESPDGTAVTDNFSYTITDGDGDTSEATVAINVSDGTAQPPELVTGDGIGYEDNAIALNISASAADSDGSESLSITISGVPNGASLSAGTDNGDGTWSLEEGDLDGLTVTPPTDSDIDFDLNVSVTSTEVATGETSTVDSTFTVEVDAVADTTTVSASVDAKLVQPESGPETEGGVIDTHNFGDTDSGFRVVGRDIDGEVDADNVVVSGGSLGVGGAAVGNVVPNQIGHNPETGEAEGIIVEFDNDVSEVSFSVSRLFENEGDKRGDASGDEQGKVILYRDGEVVGEIEFTADSGNTGTYTVKTDDGGPFDAIEFTATEYSEGDGTQTRDSSDYFVDQISFTHAEPPFSEQEPHCEITVNVDATFGDYTDGSENHFIVVEVPEGWDPQGEYVEVDSSNYGDGNFIAIQVDPADLQDSGGAISVPVTFQAPVPNEDGSVDVNVFAVAQEVNIDGTVGDGEITLDNNNYMSQATVTVEKKDMVAEDPDLKVDDSAGYEDNAIALSIDASLTDTDGSESLAITISGVPEGATLSAGTDNGDGTWSLEEGDLDGLTVTPPADSDADFDLSVSVTSTEANSGDTSTVEGEINVKVDAVADDTTIAGSSETEVGNSTVTINMNATFGDYEDGSETHVVLVEIPEGWAAPEGSTVVDGGDVNGLPDKQFVQVEVSNADLQDSDGTAAVSVDFIAPDDQASGDINFDVFSGAIESPSDSGEITLDNNTTYTGSTVTANYQDGAPTVEAGEVLLSENDLGDGSTTVTGAIDIDFGADGAGSVTIAVPEELAEMGLTSGGEDVTFEVSEDGQTITGSTPDGSPVMTITLNEDGGDYSYAVELQGPLDHGGDSDDLINDIPVELNVVDGNGESAQATINIDVADAVPQAVDDGVFNVADGGNTIGTGGGQDNLLGNDDLGADGAEITSFTYTDENGETQSADVGSTVDTEKGTLTVNADGTWAFESDDLMESPDGNPVMDNFTYTITDGDGDTSTATVEINVSDGTAQPPELVVGEAEGYEDNAIPLSIETSLTDTDGSESLSITISDVPEGASLSAGTDNGDGTWTLEEGDLDGLTVTPPTDSDVDFDLSVSVTSTESATGATSTVENTVTVEVDAVADDVDVSAEISAKVVEGEAGTETVEITADNYNAADAGFTVKGRTLDSEGNLTEASTDTVSVKTGGSATGFGVKGDVSNGANSEIGYEDGKSEQIVVDFDQDVSSANISIAWQNPNEDCRITLYRDGEPVGEVVIEGGTDRIDALGTFQADDGGSFDQIVFEATGDNSDFLVNSIEFDVAAPAEPVCEVEVDVTASFGDYTDGSEEHFVFVEVPAGMTPSDDNAVTVEGDAENGLPAGQTFVKIPVDQADIQEGSGTVTVPVSFTGPVPGEDGSINVEVFAAAIETNLDGAELTTDNNMVIKGTSVEMEKTDMVVEDPNLVAGDAEGYEDNAIALNIDASLSDTDGSETMSVTISGVPEGASLSAGTDNGDGTWSLEEGDLEGLTVTPPTDSDIDFDLSVSVTSTEQSTGETATVESTFTVEVDAVADTTTVSASVDAKLVQNEESDGLSDFTVTNEGMESASYHNTYGYYIKDEDGNPQSGGIVFADTKDGVGDSFTIEDVDADNIGFFIIPNGENKNDDLANGDAVTFEQDDSGNWHVVDADGDRLVGTRDPVLFSDPELNENNFDYTTDNAVEGNQNWEDIKGGGDNDFNDVNMNVVVTPNEPVETDPHCEVTVTVDATFGDYTDGSENHFVVVEVPEGWEPQGEYTEVDSSAYGEGTFIAVQVDPADLQDNDGAISVPVVFEVPASEAADDVDLDVFAVAQEVNIDGTVGDGEITLDNNNTMSQATVTVDGKDLTAEPPEVVVADAEGYEDNAIPLSIDANLTDTDGSESLSVTISDVPEGASLSAGTDNGDGTWTLEEGDLEGLTVTPPTDSDIDFDLSISVTSTEASTGDTSTVETSMTVEVDAVADDTTVSASVEAQLIEGEATEGVAFTLGGRETDGSKSEMFDSFDQEVGGHNISVTAIKVDGSEGQLDGDVKGGEWRGIGVKGEGDTEIDYDKNGDEGSEQIAIDFDGMELNELTVGFKALFNEGEVADGQETGQWVAYHNGEPVGSGEFDAASNAGQTDGALEINIGPDDLGEGVVFDEIRFEAAESGSDFLIQYVEGEKPGAPADPQCEVTVNVDATFGDYSDGSENHFVVVEVPEGWDPQGAYVEVDGSAYGEGNFITVQVDASDLQENGGAVSVPVTFIAPAEGSDVDVKVFAVAQEVNIDGTVGDGEITLDNNNTMSEAVVTVEGKDLTAEPPEVVVADAEGYEDNAIPLSIDANLADTDGSESLSITISGVPEGASLSAGTDNGDGTWSLEAGDLEGLTVTPPTDSDVDFDLSVSVTSTEASTGDTSTVETSFTVEVDAVADTTSVSAEISAEVIPGEAGEPQEITIGADNYDAADAGFTVAGRTIDSDGNLTDASTDQISVKSTGSPTGFGVKGDVGNGADSEIGYEDGKSEQVVINFDEDVSSADVTIAWQHSGEDSLVTLYRDGEPVGQVLVDGGTDRVDGLGTFKADDGGSFDSMVFEATGNGSDFLVHEITFETVGETTPPTCEVEVEVTATFGDYTDGSEEHFVFVEVPPGMSPSDEDLSTVEGDAQNGLPAGQTFVKVPVDASIIEEGEGSVTVPVSFTGPVPEGDEAITVDVFAGAVETNLDGTELTTDNNMSLSGTSVQLEKADITVDDPNLVTSDAEGYEDNAIALNIDASLADTDGSESMSIMISGVPDGATLSAGTDNGDGTWSLQESDLNGLTVTPPTDSDVDFDLSVAVTSTESSTGETAMVESTFTVEVDAVADTTSVEVSYSAEIVETHPATEPSTIFETSFEDVPDDARVGHPSLDVDGIEGWKPTGDSIEVWDDDMSRDLGNRRDGDNDASDGEKYIELNDVKGFEDTSNGLYREVPTEEGKVYQISFDYSGRPGYDENVNSFEFKLDGDQAGTWNHDMSGSDEHDWQTVTVSFVGTGEPMRLEFAENSETDQHYGRGMSLDNLKLVDTGEYENNETQAEITVDVSATFGDYQDGSEDHFVLVEVPQGWEAESGELIDGADVPGSTVGTTFVRIEIPQDVIEEGEGSIEVPVTFTAPVGADADVQLNVIAGAQESNLGGQELTDNNNLSISNATVTVAANDLQAPPTPEEPVVVPDEEGPRTGQDSGHGKGQDSDKGKSGSGSGHGKGQKSDKGKSGSGSGHGKGQKSDKGKSGSGSGHGKGQKSDKGKSGSGSGHGKGQKSGKGHSGSGSGHGKGQKSGKGGSGSGHGKGHGSGHGKGMSGSGQGIAAAGMDDENNLQGGDIAAAIDKFSNAAPQDDNGNQDAFRNVGASNNAGDQNNWFDEQQDQPMDDEVFGKTELEQKEEEDQQAKDAEQEEQDTGLQIPADDNNNNEADFEDRSLV